MDAHSVACLFGFYSDDGIANSPVLAENIFKIQGILFAGHFTGPDTLARNDEAAEKLQETHEVGIACRLRNCQMEPEVLGNRGLVSMNSRLERLQRDDDASGRGFVRPAACQSHRFNFDR